MLMKMNSNTHTECMHRIVTNLLYFHYDRENILSLNNCQDSSSETNGQKKKKDF